jgi:hypothetical protein
MAHGFHVRRILMCPICHKGRPTTAEQQLKYTSKGWPKCCGEVMTLYVEADKPGDDGETDEDSVELG